jgi:hypothetical protein
MRVESARHRVAHNKEDAVAESVRIQIQLSGYEVSLKDAEKPSSHLHTLGLVSRVEDRWHCEFSGHSCCG